jgi:hypothetical protein
MPQVDTKHPLKVAKNDGEITVVTNIGSPTVYYKQHSSVSPTENEGSLALGESLTLTKSTWFAATEPAAEVEIYYRGFPGVSVTEVEAALPSSVVSGSAAGLTAVQPIHGDPLRHLCRWALPPQESPTPYTLTGKFQEITAGDEEDVLIIGAPTASVGQLKVTGGRHIRIVGGEWKKTTTGASIAVINATRSVSFEGAVIDANGYNADAINACGYKSGGEHAVTNPDIYIQKCRVTGVNGTAATTHADIFQAQGPIGRLFVDLLTGTSTYQGLFIPPQFPMSSAFLSRINLTKLPSGDPEHPFTYLLWLFGLAEEPYPATLDEVYLTLPEGQTLGPDGAWPKAGSISTATGIAGQAIGAVEDGEGNVSWPNVAQVEGKLYKGAPQAGDFVAAGEVGIGYVPKGYLAPAPPLVQVVSKAELTAALAKGNTFASVLGVMFPIIGAESPLIRATEAIATANRGVFQLVRAPKGGSIREVAVWNGATINGEHRVAIFDTGQHVAGKYTVLWESAAVPAAGEGWQVIGDPALAVEPNALLFFAIMNSGTTHLFGTGTALVGTTASLPPAGYSVPRLLGEHNFGSLSFGAAGASITVAQLEAFNRNILIGASVR